MRVALCFSGKVGTLVGKHTIESGKDTRRESLKLSSESIIKHIIEPNDVDIFIHTWDVDLVNDLNMIYKPKLIVPQKQIVFDIPKHLLSMKKYKSRVQAHYSRWYSNKKSVELKSQYEKDNNFTYDMVIVLRFDTVWFTTICFDQYSNGDIHLPKQIFKRQTDHWGYPNVNSPEVIDHFIFSNSDTIDTFYKSMFDKLDEYTMPNACPSWKGISHHFLIVWHLRKLGLLDLIKFTYTFYDHNSDVDKPIDYTLVRHYDEIELHRSLNDYLRS